MIIIVEGIDRVGKTTLCNKLSNDLNIPIFKEDVRNIKKSKNLMYANYGSMDSVINVCNLLNKNTILDRFYLTEYIYGKIERKYKNKKANKFFKAIDKKLAELENKVILILVQPVDVEKSSKEHGKSLFLHDICFSTYFKSSKIKNKIIVNYYSLEKAVTYVKEIIENEKCTNSIDNRM